MAPGLQKLARQPRHVLPEEEHHERRHEVRQDDAQVGIGQPDANLRPVQRQQRISKGIIIRISTT
jgi:hypothetical protein